MALAQAGVAGAGGGRARFALKSLYKWARPNTERVSRRSRRHFILLVLLFSYSGATYMRRFPRTVGLVLTPLDVRVACPTT